MNECELARPCYPGVRCINLHPGYRCDHCPRGYVGSFVEGIGVEMARSQRQICRDIDECENNNGGCDPYLECINTEVRNLRESFETIETLKRVYPDVYELKICRCS